MNILDFSEFIQEYEKIEHLQGHQAAEQFLNQSIEWIKMIDDVNIMQLYLEFLSEITGESQAFQRLTQLLTHFQNKK